MPIGEKLLIRPVWEDNYDAGDRKVLNIEPGLAFGTGSHPTTKLCLETLEKYVTPDTTVLDIGCGSGILSIACLLLGSALFAYYCMFAAIAIELTGAVYYTFQLK